MPSHPDTPSRAATPEAGPPASGRPLVLALLALLVLTAISWGVAHLPLGRAAIPIALAIAAIKAAVVAYWFMELPLASTPAKIVAMVTLVFIALLCAGTVGDLGLR
jgi:cytochrome c oxidase subunit 4